MNSNKILYWGLVILFASLYLLVAGVSLFHAIEFFQLTNTKLLAVLLAIGFELGQAGVLFSILISKKKQDFLTWLMMILLTLVQVTANVFSCFKFIETLGGDTWVYWQRSILFFMVNSDPEFNKVIISWIAGGILPLVALGMTALIAEKLKIGEEEYIDEEEYEWEEEEIEEPEVEIEEEVKEVEEKVKEIEEEVEEPELEVEIEEEVEEPEAEVEEVEILEVKKEEKEEKEEKEVKEEIEKKTENLNVDEYLSKKSELPLLNLNELNNIKKPSRGQELINKISLNNEDDNLKINITDGVEIVDVKAISKDKDN